MSTEQGADTVLRHAAEDVGKPVDGLETLRVPARHVHTHAAARSRRRIPSAAARTKAAVASMLTQLQAAWNRGDRRSFAPMLEQMERNSPDTYRMMFTERNARWAAVDRKRACRQPGTVFVAVGAGHLAGKDSVQQ